MPDPVAVLMASNAALNRLDVDGMLANYAEDAVVVDHRQVAFGTFSGKAELSALYGGIVTSASEFTETVRVLAAAGDTVVADCEVAAKLAADPHGPVIGAEYGYVATVTDGRIARLELFDDGEAALEASGLEPSA